MRSIAVAFVCLVLAGGCATQRVIIEDKAAGESRLFVTRSGEQVTLSWESDPGMIYTVFYNHTRSSKSPWKILPGFDHIRGTGRSITYQDTVPISVTRYYRLQTLPAVSVSP